MGKILNTSQVWGEEEKTPDLEWCKQAISRCAREVAGLGGKLDFVCFICPFCGADVAVVRNIDRKQVVGLHAKIPCAKFRENELGQYILLVNRQGK
jgi:hypothetical protein